MGSDNRAPSKGEESSPSDKKPVHRRRILQATGAFAAAGLAGCSDSDSGDSGNGGDGGNGGGSTGKTVTVITGESDPATKKLFKNATADFEKETGIKVEYEYTSFANLQQALAERIRAGNAPELQQGTPGDAAALLSEDMLAPLTDVIDDLDIPDNIVLETSGEKWLVPYSQKLYMHTVRRDLVEETGGEVPMDLDGRFDVGWDQFQDWVTSIDEQTDTRGTILTPARNSRGTTEGITWMWSNGVRIWRGPSDDIQVTIDEGQDRERAIEVLNYVNDLHDHAPSGADYGWADASQAYASGSGASVMYSTGRILGVLGDTNPDWQSEEYTVPIQVPFNQLRDDGVRSWNSASGYMLVDQAENKDAAKEYIRWFWNSDYFIDFLHTVPFHLSPPWPDMMDTEEYRSHDLINSRPDVLDFQKRLIEEQQTLPFTFTADDHGVNLGAGRAYSEGSLGYLLSLVTIEDQKPEAAIDEVASELRGQL